MKLKFEVKLGIFVLLSLIIFMGFVLTLGKNNIFKSYKEFVVSFDFIEGLKRLSPVRFSGYDVGIVKDIKVSPKGRPVFVYLWVEKGLTIPRDSQIFINTLGVLGEKYVEIIPGESDIPIKEKEIIKGVSPVPFRFLAQKASGVLDKFEVLIGGLQDKLEDPKINEDFRNLLSNMNKTFFEAQDILSKIRADKGTLGRFIYDDSLYENINALIKDLKENPWKLLHRPRRKRR